MTAKLDITQFATFSDGELISSVINLGDSGTLEGIEAPSNFKQSNVQLRVSVDNSTFNKVVDANGSEVIVRNLAAKCYTPLNGTITKGVKFLKLERDGIVGQETLRVVIRHVN